MLSLAERITETENIMKSNEKGLKVKESEKEVRDNEFREQIRKIEHKLVDSDARHVKG